MLQHYLRFSNVSNEYLIADVGSVLQNDAGTMGGYESITLDRALYKYNCYHFAISSLGTDLVEYLRCLQRTQSAFDGAITVRTQPTVTNLLSADDTVAVAEYSTTLPAMPKLNWDFKN